MLSHDNNSAFVRTTASLTLTRKNKFVLWQNIVCL